MACPTEVPDIQHLQPTFSLRYLTKGSATCRLTILNQAYGEYKHAHADISRSTLYAFAVYKAMYVVIATKPVHRLQIRLIVHH